MPLTPIQYLMQQMSRLHNDTALLEVCDWEEEKVEKLIENLNTVLIDMDASLPENLKRFCRNQDYISEHNRDALYGLLKQSIVMELQESAREEEEYEN